MYILFEEYSAAWYTELITQNVKPNENSYTYILIVKRLSIYKSGKNNDLASCSIVYVGSDGNLLLWYFNTDFPLYFIDIVCWVVKLNLLTDKYLRLWRNLKGFWMYIICTSLSLYFSYCQTSELIMIKLWIYLDGASVIRCIYLVYAVLLPEQGNGHLIFFLLDNAITMVGT